jgi:GntR family transcriptional regulator
MREALILLEEDGLIRTQRGIGRFIVDVLPKVGIEELRPIEEFLGIPGRSVSVKRLRATREALTDFTRRGLGPDEDSEALMWESTVEADGSTLALTQEWVRADAAGDPGAPSIADILAPREGDGVSMLGALATGLEDKLSSGVCEISVSNAGLHRAQLLGITDGSPVLLLTQTVSYRNGPLLLAKYIIRAEGTHLSVIQS